MPVLKVLEFSMDNVPLDDLLAEIGEGEGLSKATPLKI